MGVEAYQELPGEGPLPAPVQVYGAGVWASLALMCASAVCGSITDLAFDLEGYLWQLVRSTSLVVQVPCHASQWPRASRAAVRQAVCHRHGQPRPHKVHPTAG